MLTFLIFWVFENFQEFLYELITPPVIANMDLINNFTDVLPFTGLNSEEL